MKSKFPADWPRTARTGATLVGRHVRLRRRMETQGGLMFEEGEVLLITRLFGGLHLQTVKHCMACSRGRRLSITRVSPRSVELLPEGYTP
jgi:hypothetical protein